MKLCADLKVSAHLQPMHSTIIDPKPMNTESTPDMVAVIDFDCIEKDCEATIYFNLLNLKKNAGKVSCSHCHKLYQFDKKFIGKLEKLRILILAVRDAEDILGDCNISIVTPAGDVKLPYRLLLTRLNTLISFKCNGKELEFNFRVEPLNDTTFK